VVSRYHKRKAVRETKKLVEKAKKAMADWMTGLAEVPTEKEVRAWQAGYVAGINQNDQ
jgi:hypothetical protein